MLQNNAEFITEKNKKNNTTYLKHNILNVDRTM